MPVDTTPPSVSITAPASGATVSGVAVTVAVNASDDTAVSGVQIKLDGANLGAEDTSAPYAVTWNSTSAGNGPHTLTAVARDGSGNTTTSAPVNVTVSNVASCSAQTVLNTQALVSDSGFAYAMSASFGTPADNSSNPTRSLLRLIENGVELGPAHSAHDDIRTLGAGRFSHWSGTGGANEAVRFSASDNTDPRTNGRVYSYCVNLVDTTAPTVSITAPANGATVQGSAVPVTANASDNVGVVGVQFKLDGANLGAEDTTSPFTVPWDTTQATNASHALTAVARDAAGNTTTSVAVTVSVNNPIDKTSPVVAITAPASGSTVSGIAVTVSANASDDVSVAGVQFQLDDVNLGAEDGSSPYSISWNTTATPNGQHMLTAIARDGAGNTTTSGPTPVTVNNGVACPQVSLDLAATVTDTGFAYLVPGSFGVAADNNSAPTQSTLRLLENGADLGPPHSLHSDIRTLGRGRFSHWAGTGGANESVRLATSDNTDPRSNGRTYTYCVPPGDTTPPTVSITAPAPGATVSGASVTVSATAQDNVGIVGVQFRLDGNNLGTEDTTVPYSITWNTGAASNGNHALTARARDAAGNTTLSASVTVTVTNATDVTPPSVSITAPAAGATVSGAAAAVTATASDNVAVVGVQFKLDGANLGPELTSGPYTVAWDSATIANGAHALSVVARDAAGNSATSAPVSVTVSNATPCVLTVLDTSAAGSDTGFGYVLSRSYGTPADSNANPTASLLKLLENRVDLGPAHSLHDDIRLIGLGRFSHWVGAGGANEAVRFATSDNSDPRTNGRTYAYCVP